MDLMGKYTYIGYNGVSTVDYVLAFEDILTQNFIHFFKVEELTLLSDHRPIIVTVQFKTDNVKQLDNTLVLKTSKRKKLVVNDYGYYKTELNKRMSEKCIRSIISKLENITKNTKPNLNSIIQEITDMYINNTEKMH